MSELVHVNGETFDAEVLKADKPVLFTIGAPWCGDCRRAQPFLIAMAKVYGDRMKFVTANADESPELKTRWNVGHIPTMIIFKNGKALDGQLVEVKTPSELKDFIEKGLAA